MCQPCDVLSSACFCHYTHYVAQAKSLIPVHVYLAKILHCQIMSVEVVSLKTVLLGSELVDLEWL